MATAAAVASDASLIAAWMEYLTSCRSASHPWAYDEVEEWAWARLQQRLRALDLQSR